MITREEILQQQRRQAAIDRASYDEHQAKRRRQALDDAIGSDEAEQRIASLFSKWKNSGTAQAEFSAGQLKMQVVDELLTRNDLDPDKI